jgi:serine/threonine protein phosphatase PrpC
MKLAIHASGKSDVGLVRTNNEDCIGFDVRSGIFVLSDGMGGQAAGEVASKIAVETIMGYFQHRRSDDRQEKIVGREFAGVSGRAHALANAIQLANQAIHTSAASDPSKAGMGATIVALRIEGNLFSIAHVGDSRIYLIRAGVIQRLTSDHSFVTEQVRRGLISQEEADHSKMQNVIVRALGSEETVEPDLADHELTAGDLLLLCCDGLTQRLTDASLLELANRTENLDQACEGMIQAAKDAGSDDNVSCILIRAAERGWLNTLFR